MLNGIDKRMSPALLHCLARMGHGDEIVIADANFPTDSTAHTCVIPQPLDMTGLDAPATISLITSLMPLDGFTDYSALRMEIDDQPDEMGDVHREAWAVLKPHLPEGGALSSIERQDFYHQASQSFAVVRTSDTRPYGCFILRKGVVF